MRLSADLTKKQPFFIAKANPLRFFYTPNPHREKQLFSDSENPFILKAFSEK